MKVLILTADSNGGYPVPAVKGGAVSTLIEHLVAGNNEKRLCDMEIVSFYDPQAEKKAREKYKNITFHWIKVPGVLKFLDKWFFNFVRFFKKSEKAISFCSLFSLLYYIYKAKKIANRTDADKIVIENNIPLARVMKNSKFNGQWYYHFHNVPRIDAGCREEFQKVTKFLCVSQFVANQITGEDSAIGRIDPKKTSVLLNCVDINLFKHIDKNHEKIKALKLKYEIKDDDRLIIFAGRLSKEKGADILLRAAQDLPPNVKILIVGSLISSLNVKDEFQERLLSLSKKLKKRVIFTGYVNQKELPFYYNMSNIAVLPSMWDEPAGLTNLEAMACEIPVITTLSGGIPEYAKGAIMLDRNESIIGKIRKNIVCLINGEYLYDVSIPLINARNNSKDLYIDKFIEMIRY